jgi:hypothetical protein
MRDTIAVTTRIVAQLELVAVTTVLSRRARSTFGQVTPPATRRIMIPPFWQNEFDFHQ